MTLNSYEFNKLPFGIHKNKPLNLVPTSYLEWSLKQLVELCQHIQKELKTRENDKPFIPKWLD